MHYLCFDGFATLEALCVSASIGRTQYTEINCAGRVEDRYSHRRILDSNLTLISKLG